MKTQYYVYYYIIGHSMGDRATIKGHGKNELLAITRAMFLIDSSRQKITKPTHHPKM